MHGNISKPVCDAKQRKRDRAELLCVQLTAVIAQVQRGWCRDKAMIVVPVAINGYHHRFDTLTCLSAAISLNIRGRRRHLYDAIARELPKGFAQPRETPLDQIIRFNDKIANSADDVIAVCKQARAKAAQIVVQLDQGQARQAMVTI
jgi:hypothetical protein